MSDGQGFGVVELNVVVMVEFIFSHCQPVVLSELDMPVVFFHLGVNRLVSLCDVDLATLAMEAVYARVLQYLVIPQQAEREMQFLLSGK